MAGTEPGSYPLAMSGQARRLLGILALAALAAGLAYGLARWAPGSSRVETLEMVPAGAELIARVDVQAVLSSSLFRRIAEEDRGGMRRVERACGYDPIEGIRELVIFGRGAADVAFDDVGFIARGPALEGRRARARLLECVERVVGGEGGRLERVEVEGQPALASASGPSIAAFVSTDGVTGGDRATVEAVLRASARAGERAGGDADLRREPALVEPGHDITLVGRVPSGWRAALGGLGRGIEGLETLSAIRDVALGAALAEGLRLAVVLGFDRPGDAVALAAGLERQRAIYSRHPLVRLSLLGPILARTRLEAEGNEVRVAVRLTDAQVDTLVSLLRELQDSEAAGERVVRSLGQPDEVLRRGGDAPSADDPSPDDPSPEGDDPTEPSDSTE